MRATLNIEEENGQASVTLKAGLLFIPPPAQAHKPARCPAYQRRQDRRQAARLVTEITAPAAQAEQVCDELIGEFMSY